MIAAPARSAGAAEAFVDLHAHSTASDGSATPEGLVLAASDAGLSAVALTDHDTLGGLDEAAAAAVRLGVRLVPGVELSAMDGDREVHVLGLHVERSGPLEDALSTFRDTRVVRAREIVARLNALGVPLTFDAVAAHAGGGAIGRPHLARALIEEGWARDSRDAFDRYLGAGRPAYVPKHRLDMADAIGLIHAAGGLAILAHPGGEGRRETVQRFVALGLDGLEVRHPGHSAEDVARLTALADFFGLAASGGSDWHGATEGPRVLGAMRVPAVWLEDQDRRVMARRAASRSA